MALTGSHPVNLNYDKEYLFYIQYNGVDVLDVHVSFDGVGGNQGSLNGVGQGPSFILYYRAVNEGPHTVTIHYEVGENGDVYDFYYKELTPGDSYSFKTPKIINVSENYNFDLTANKNFTYFGFVAEIGRTYEIEYPTGLSFDIRTKNNQFVSTTYRYHNGKTFYRFYASVSEYTFHLITYRTGDDLPYNINCRVNIPVDGVYSGDTITLKVGETAIAEGYAYPDDATDTSITFSIVNESEENEGVASITEDGLVTALKVGNTLGRITSNYDTRERIHFDIIVIETPKSENQLRGVEIKNLYFGRMYVPEIDK